MHADQGLCQCSPPIPTRMGTSLCNGVVGHWQALPVQAMGTIPADVEHELKRCACGCNEYSGIAIAAPRGGELPPEPVLPITLEYEDDSLPSDDHEYVSIHAEELAALIQTARNCTCDQP